MISETTKTKQALRKVGAMMRVEAISADAAHEYALCWALTGGKFLVTATPMEHATRLGWNAELHGERYGMMLDRSLLPEMPCELLTMDLLALLTHARMSLVRAVSRVE